MVLGMLFNAYEGHTPLLVTAGQQDRGLRLREPMLSADLVAMAAPLSKWSVQVEAARDLPHVMRLAFKIANDPPMGPVFLALPIDVMEMETVSDALSPVEGLCSQCAGSGGYRIGRRGTGPLASADDRLRRRNCPCPCHG